MNLRVWNYLLVLLNFIMENSCYYQKFVIDRLDDDFFGGVLGNIEAKFKLLLGTVLLDKWRVKTRQPVGCWRLCQSSTRNL